MLHYLFCWQQTSLTGRGAETAFSSLAAAAVASQIWLGIVCLFKTRKLWCQTVKESNSHLHHVGARLLENSLSETGLHPHSLLQRFYNDNNKQCCFLDFWTDYHYFTVLSFAVVTINKVKERYTDIRSRLRNLSRQPDQRHFYSRTSIIKSSYLSYFSCSYETS